MNRLNNRQLDDLKKLAAERCVQSFGSVAQLVEDDREAYGMALTVACSFVMVAVDLLQDGMEHQNGRRPPKADVLNHAIGDVLDGMGIKWKRSRSLTPSAKK